MRGEQLDLLSWNPPAGAIVAFPLCARSNLVRLIVDRLSPLSRADGDRLWRQLASAQAQRLKSLGISKKEIDRQVLDLRDAVSWQLADLGWYGEATDDRPIAG